MQFFKSSRNYAVNRQQSDLFAAVSRWKNEPSRFKLERYPLFLIHRGQLRDLESLLLNADYILLSANLLPEQEDHLRQLAASLSARRKVAPEKQFKIISSIRVFRSLAILGETKDKNPSRHLKLVLTSNTDIHTRFSLLLCIFYRELQHNIHESTCRAMLVDYLRSFALIDNIHFRKDYGRDDSQLTEISWDAYTLAIKLTLKSLIQDQEVSGLLCRFVGFAQFVTWISRRIDYPSDPVRYLLLAHGKQRLEDFHYADKTYRAFENIENVVSLVHILILYKTNDLLELIWTQENLDFFSTILSRYYESPGTIVWTSSRLPGGDSSKKASIRQAVANPLLIYGSENLEKILIQIIEAACPYQGLGAFQFAIQYLVENRREREILIENVCKQPFWQDLSGFERSRIISLAHIVTGSKFRLSIARDYCGITWRDYLFDRLDSAFGHTFYWISKQLGKLRSKLRPQLANANTLSEVIPLYLSGDDVILSYFLAYKNQRPSGSSRYSAKTIEKYRKETIRAFKILLKKSDDDTRKILLLKYKISHDVEPLMIPVRVFSALPILATRRSLFLARSYLQFSNAIGESEIERFWRFCFLSRGGYFSDRAHQFFREKPDWRFRIMRPLFLWWFRRVVYYLMDRLRAPYRTYETLLDKNYEAASKLLDTGATDLDREFGKLDLQRSRSRTVVCLIFALTTLFFGVRFVIFSLSRNSNFELSISHNLDYILSETQIAQNCLHRVGHSLFIKETKGLLAGVLHGVVLLFNPSFVFDPPTGSCISYRLGFLTGSLGMLFTSAFLAPVYAYHRVSALFNADSNAD